jgi:HEAT repeat protein
MAIKKAFENINQPIVIDHLVAEILKNNHQVNENIKRIMVAVGSEEIALALSEIIAHPIRQVRQLSLRILAELGKASLRVFSRILIDDSWFEREEGRNELTDSKWYVVRNSIFVIGSLKDSEGLAPLRLRLKDPDVRVRREIVTALEKIGCEDAVDLLALMAEDSQADIAQAAVIAIGMTGTVDAVPLLIDIGRRNRSVILRVIAALGRIGGDEARRYLVELLADDDRQVDLAEGKVSKDDLLVAIVRALGAIGDRPSLDGIRSFKEAMPATRKVLFKNSPLQKAISEILARP